MSSTLTVTNLTATNLTDGGGTTSTFANINQGHSKAWVNFNGTGTVAIRDSQNVSSLTDLSSANYTINFSNNFSAADYSFSGLAGVGAASGNYYFATPFNSAPAVGSFSIRISDFSGTITDVAYNAFNFHGDLA